MEFNYEFGFLMDILNGFLCMEFFMNWIQIWNSIFIVNYMEFKYIKH